MIVDLCLAAARPVGLIVCSLRKCRIKTNSALISADQFLIRSGMFLIGGLVSSASIEYAHVRVHACSHACSDVRNKARI